MTPAEAQRFIGRQGVLLDTGVLLLHLLQAEYPKLIGRGRLSDFNAATAQALDNALPQKFRMITTPHIQTEASNLLRQMISGDDSAKLLGNFAKTADEQTVEASVACEDASLHGRYGLADTVSAVLVRQEQFVFITVDAPLAVAINSRPGGTAVNLHHMSLLL
jgi:hypothetical protein